MNDTPQPDTGHLLAYPEPPASPLWHRRGAKAGPLTDAEKQRNRELLVLAQRKPPHHHPRVVEPPCSPT
ncbi:hypothetical protein [Streptomyces sp. NPDC029674]|uniref:hypothetical protein n=1 Tax=Streptomyces sp. NPDC029674 TaxID=3365297 RepID=UPI0038513F16